MTRMGANRLGRMNTIKTFVAVLVLFYALGLQAQEVTYSELEMKLSPPPAGPANVQLASHSEPLLTPEQQDFIPAEESFGPQPQVEQEAPLFVSPEGCADCVGPEYWEFNPWYAGAELTIFSTRYSSPRFSLSAHRTAVGLRPYLGYERIDGAGMPPDFWGGGGSRGVGIRRQRKSQHSDRNRAGLRKF